MEANNIQAMREALCDIVMLTMKVGHSIHGDVACGIIESKAERALSAPARNCDVGTAEDQTERFKQLCRKYRRGPGPRANCKGCPISHESQHVGCTFAWAQMPYEEGGVK